MRVTALAEAFVSVRRSDGYVSLHEIQSRLSRDGLHELARAVVSLARRADHGTSDRPASIKHPWL